MHRVGGWLGYKQENKGSTQSLDSLDETYQIEDAMKAASHIMNDDVETADAQLSEGNSPFHKLGKGVVVFIRATLGFEQDIMREASERLAGAESSALEHQRRALRKPHTYHSPIYPVGTEYALCNATAQLMGAVVCVLNESLTESIRGFYKLRKAYITLNGILAAEQEYVKKRQSQIKNKSTESASSTSQSDPDQLNEGWEKVQKPTISPGSKSPVLSDDGDEFVDADENYEGLATPKQYMGHLQSDKERPNSSEVKISEPPAAKSNDPPPEGASMHKIERVVTNITLKDGPDPDLFGDHAVDVFIHSCSNLCFGILMLMISLIPPAFATLLKIVGFRGDREKGITMLWQASKFSNIFGGMAGLVLFGYYNGLVGFCDIIPESGPGSYPTERCKVLLAEMRKRYPSSQLWQLEEARMMASDRQLENAVKAIAHSRESDLRQVVALQWFERSLNCMYMHDYEQTSKSFQKCVELNSWSHGLYYYIAGSAHVQLYRKNKSLNPKEAEKHAKLAEDLLRLVPKNTGKKRFMARQLPFDIFINRKLQKWESHAKERKIDLIDAIGVSPIEEMIYFWNGYKRMTTEHLEESLANLTWSSKENPHWEKESIDEQSVSHVLSATVLRNLKRTAEAKELLQTKVIPHDWSEFKGQLKDSWTAPCARYEMAANLWIERDNVENSKEKLAECGKYLDEVAQWEAYDLDARIGLKVTTARETLQRLGITVSP